MSIKRNTMKKKRILREWVSYKMDELSLEWNRRINRKANS